MNSDPSTADYAINYAPAYCFEEDFSLPWEMVRTERICLLHLLKQFRPELSLEIGTYRGGSLQVLSRYSKEVISIDIDPNVELNLKGLFGNVTFRSGDSSIILPEVIDEINSSDKRTGIVLIDGDHSEEGLRRDINAVLKLRPKNPVGIVIHDCFHPPTRAGMRSADWTQSPYIHYVEIDFIDGTFIPGRFSTDESMYCGFGFALMLPEKRTHNLRISESEREKFEIVRRFARRSGFLITPGNQIARLLRRAKTLLTTRIANLVFHALVLTWSYATNFNRFDDFLVNGIVHLIEPSVCIYLPIC